jgi:hypothetical protein
MKLMASGSAPRIFLDITHMVRAGMVMNPFKIYAMEDTIMAVHCPKSRSIHIFGEVDILKQTDMICPKSPWGVLLPPLLKGQLGQIFIQE